MKRAIFATAFAVVITALMLNQELMAQSTKPQTRYFCGIGIVVSIDEDKSGVTINHQTIDGYMAAMTMHFKTADLEVLGDVGVGHRVRFTLKDTPDLTRLIYIERVAPQQHRKRRH